MAQRLRDTAPRWGELLPQLPELHHEVLSRVRDGQLQVRLSATELEGIRSELRAGGRRTTLAIAGAALLLSAAILATGDHPVAALAPLLRPVSLLSLAGVGGVLLALAWWRG